MRYAIATEVRSQTARRPTLGRKGNDRSENSLFHEHVAKRVAERVIFVAKDESPFSFVHWIAKDSQLAIVACKRRRHVSARCSR